MEQSNENWVTVAAYTSPWMAHLAKARLEADGIECELADEHTANIDWVYANAIGGVKLRVHPAAASEAHQILSEASEIPEFEDDGDPSTEERGPTPIQASGSASSRSRRPVNARVAAGGRRTLGAKRLIRPFETPEEPGGPVTEQTPDSDAASRRCPDCQGTRIVAEGSVFARLIAAVFAKPTTTYSCLNCGRSFRP